jgi:hypothetical protein
MLLEIVTVHGTESPEVCADAAYCLTPLSTFGGTDQETLAIDLVYIGACVTHKHSGQTTSGIGSSVSSISLYGVHVVFVMAVFEFSVDFPEIIEEKNLPRGDLQLDVKLGITVGVSTPGIGTKAKALFGLYDLKLDTFPAGSAPSISCLDFTPNENTGVHGIESFGHGIFHVSQKYRAMNITISDIGQLLHLFLGHGAYTIMTSVVDVRTEFFFDPFEVLVDTGFTHRGFLHPTQFSGSSNFLDLSSPYSFSM